MIAETIILWTISHLHCPYDLTSPLRGRCVLRTTQGNPDAKRDRWYWSTNSQKIKARFRKVNLFFKANVYLGIRWCIQSYPPLTTERLRSCAQ